MMTDLNALRVFDQVAKHKSFRAAAAALSMPPSTVSAKIAFLEEQLGARLFERTTRRVALTDAGQSYHQRIAPALDVLVEADLEIRQERAVPTGRLRVSTTVEFGQYANVLSDVLATYVTICPHVDVDVVLLDRRVDLVSEGIDVAIRVGSLPDSSLRVRGLGTAGAMRLVASRAYLAQRGVPTHPRDLRDHDCLVMSANSAKQRWRFDVAGRALSVDVQGRVVANSFTLLRKLAEADAGIARLPSFLTPQETSCSNLEPVLKRFWGPQAKWHALYPSERHLSQKVRVFIDLLAERFERASSGTSDIG